MTTYLKIAKTNGKVSAGIYYDERIIGFTKQFIQSNNFGTIEELTKEEYDKLVNPNNVVDNSNYYIIVSENEDQEILYLWIINGEHMLQSNIYDSSKFLSRELAEKRLEIVSKEFEDNVFDIIPINQLIFGGMPKHIERLESGYITNKELQEYSKEDQKKIKIAYSKYPKDFFNTPKAALCGYDTLIKTGEATNE